MRRLFIIGNNRKRFVLLRATAAVLILLSGGAAAQAQPTLRCVPTSNPDPRCTGAPTYPTIQAAVTAAVAGDIILVAPGKYNESVTVDETGHSRDGLALLGAQAGNDARVDRHNPSEESVVDGTNQPVGSTIVVEALNVVIDGFTVQGATANVGTATGIDLKGLCKGLFSPANGSVVVNNIIQGNANGISLNQEECGVPGNYSYPPTAGSAVLVGALVERNLIRNNNSTTLGYGNGINARGVNLARLTHNALERNLNIAISIFYSNYVTATNNTSRSDGVFALFFESSNSDFSDNHGEGFAAEGIPLTDAVGAVTVAVSNGIVITHNHLEKGNHPIQDGLELGSYAVGLPPCQNLYVTSNHIERFPGNGIYLDDWGVLDSFILGNKAERNDLDGIFVYKPGNAGNSFFDNQASGNLKNDCEDDTIGPGTLGTADTWFNNTGNLSSPTGLCTPGKGH